MASYDQGEGTREEIARRYRVSVGMVKKLLQQRRALGDIAPQHHRSGRKPKILAEHRTQLESLLQRQPDLTLEELRTAVQLDCTLPAIHYVLVELGLTYKKRHSARASKTARISSASGERGGSDSPVSIPPGSSSSMNRGRKRT